MGLRLETISHSYARVPVIREVSLTVGPGQVACLLGPSGCGKTTLLRLAAGLEPVQHGCVSIGGRLVADGEAQLHVPPEQRNAGLMFQDYALFPHLTVLGNVTFGIGNKSAARVQWVRDALERLGLAAHAGTYPHTLSGGEQQRCALLRALAPEPDVLLLDEPFSGLDVTRRAQVREETLTILREACVSTLIVTHDPEEAMFMADRLWIMNEGRIVQHGPPGDIYLHPRDAFVAALFGPLNRIQGRIRNGRLATPLGSLPAPHCPEGGAAAALIRPEAVLVSAGGGAGGGASAAGGDIGTRQAVPVANGHGGQEDGAMATVVSARLLGRTTHMRLALPALTEPLQALVPGVVLPEPGREVAVALDPAHAFVFPLS